MINIAIEVTQEEAPKFADIIKDYVPYSFKGCIQSDKAYYTFKLDDDYKILREGIEKHSSDLEGTDVINFSSCPFFRLPKEIRDEIVNRSAYKSPFPYIIDIMQGRYTGGFNWTESPEGLAFWQAVLLGGNYALFYNHFKLKNNESRLQEQDIPVHRDSRTSSVGIRSRFNKARITVKHLGHQEVIGRG